MVRGRYEGILLFLIVFPTGNAIAERGFSAMAAAHNSSRSQLGHEQTFVHMLINFNGPSTGEFAERIDTESTTLGINWWGYINPTNLNH